MRIGVITIDAGANYGAALQCYAFQKKLESLGHKVEFLRDKPIQISRYYSLKAKLSVTRFSDFVKLIKRKRSHPVSNDDSRLYAVFEAFREKYFHRSPILDVLEIGEYANKHYDAIIVGSDQIWTWLFDPNKIAFIGWQPEFKGIRLSYASCSAYENFRGFRAHKDKLSVCLNKFEYISVRDETTKKLVKNISGLSADIVSDPVELYDYKEFLNDEPVVEGKYILAYILGNEIAGGHLNALRIIKEQFGDMPVIGVRTLNSQPSLFADRILSEVTPNQWVNLVSKATVVYTDSFHAILFSMKFNRPFLAYYKDTVRSSRLIHLKEKWSLDNIVKSVNEIPIIKAATTYNPDLSGFKKLSLIIDKKNEY